MTDLAPTSFPSMARSWTRRSEVRVRVIATKVSSSINLPPYRCRALSYKQRRSTKLSACFGRRSSPPPSTPHLNAAPTSPPLSHPGGKYTRSEPRHRPGTSAKQRQRRDHPLNDRIRSLPEAFHRPGRFHSPRQDPVPSPRYRTNGRTGAETRCTTVQTLTPAPTKPRPPSPHFLCAHDLSPKKVLDGDAHRSRSGRGDIPASPPTPGAHPPTTAGLGHSCRQRRGGGALGLRCGWPSPDLPAERPRGTGCRGGWWVE